MIIILKITRQCQMFPILYIIFKNMKKTTTDGSSSTIIPNPTKLVFLLLLVVLTEVNCNNLKVYPLADDYFEKIYIVNINSHDYYLNIGCREANMLSVSLTANASFMEQPRFNIYGNAKPLPKMAKKSYTFLHECEVFIDVEGDHMLQLKRKQGEQPFFALNEVNFEVMHNSFKIIDHSTKWGLGQRFQSKFKITNGKWTLWNRDKPWKIDRGLPNLSDQTYGFQPIYLARNKQTKKHHLVYFKNTYGMLVDITNNGNQLQYHSVGGPIHFLIIVGQQNPEAVLEQYHDYIGPSLVPPFWSMGNHQCRWGYKTADKLNQVLTKFKDNDLPVDTIWSDLDYMDRKMIFTVNKVTHGDKINKIIKDHSVHFVPLLDVGVSVNDKNAMDMGKRLDVFFRDYRNPKVYYEAEVWPGRVHFVDFLHPNAITFWKMQMKRLYDQVQFSGIWIDMNEPSNFRGNEPTKETFRIQQNQGINMMTLNVDLPHYTTMNDSLTHREVHTYYGHLSTIPINEFLKQVGKRPFIISRSNNVGSGHFAGHWTGDNVANWDFLRLSINGNFLFQIFGIQMVGSDICGFYGHTTEELCARWYQVGAFYPFMRNHNHEQNRDQEPWAFGATLLKTSRESIKTRYALLKYMYSIMVEKKGRGSYFRPLNFEFSLDEKVYEDEIIQTQILIGKALMITPIVTEKQVQRNVYFPGSDQEWYSFAIESTNGLVKNESIQNYHGKDSAMIRNQMPSAAPTFLRGGFGLLINKPENRVKDLKNTFNIFAALKNGTSVAKIMTIEDYDYEPHLALCLSEGCFMEITLKKIESNSFVLTWTYTGNKELLGPISIQTITVVQADRKWTYQSASKLKGESGSYSFEMLPL